MQPLHLTICISLPAHAAARTAPGCRLRCSVLPACKARATGGDTSQPSAFDAASRDLCSELQGFVQSAALPAPARKAGEEGGAAPQGPLRTLRVTEREWLRLAERTWRELQRSGAIEEWVKTQHGV